MRSMVIDRRGLLAWIAGGITLSFATPDGRAAPARRLYLNARGGTDGAFHVSGIGGGGEAAFDLPIPARGHGFAVHPTRPIAVCFARRPGTFARVLDFERGTFSAAFETPDGRHFYGHGAFGPDGRLLYAAENDFAGERGVIGVYDAADRFRRVGELDARGIGPHDVQLMPDGTTLAVAIGGILTHPDLPRAKLNLPTMAPALVYLDRTNGTLLHRARLADEMHLLGIRHLAVAGDGTVAIAMQYEGPAGDAVPLIATHKGGEPIATIDGPEPVMRSMKHYCGGVAFDAAGAVIGVSSPRGHVMTFWEAATGRHLASVAVADGCGLAPEGAAGTFLASSGKGGLFRIDARSGTRRPLGAAGPAGAFWDNHMEAVGI